MIEAAQRLLEACMAAGVDFSVDAGREAAPADELAVLLADDGLYAEVVERLHRCTRSGDIRRLVCAHIKARHRHGAEVVCGARFVRAILPHLTCYAQSRSVKTLQNALL